MANQLIASIYGFNGYARGTNNGLTKGLPTQGAGILIEDISSAPSSFNGVSCISTITLLPTGLKVNGDVYYSATAAATLITAANA